MTLFEEEVGHFFAYPAQAQAAKTHAVAGAVLYRSSRPHSSMNRYVPVYILTARITILLPMRITGKFQRERWAR